LTHCPECNFEFPPGLQEYPANCPRCGVPLNFPNTPPAHEPRRRINYAYLRYSPTIYIIGICVLVYLVEVAFSGSLDPSVNALFALGALNGQAVFAGQWWRMLASVFLHGGVLHIGFNMWALFNLGILAEILYGRRNYVILFLLCGLGGSALSIIWHPNQVGVGASGAIFGIAGALLPALKFQRNPRVAAALRGSFGSIGLFVIYNLLFGAAVPFIDNAAHLGGLITGAVTGYFLPAHTVEEERKQTGRASLVFIIVFMIIVGITLYARKLYSGS
jgi:rhomboid protease GluP